MKSFSDWVQEDHMEGGYWVGSSGHGASGILPIAADTKNICLAWRNESVAQGDCYGTIGGAITEGTPEKSAIQELREETGYRGTIKCQKAFVFKDGSFQYHNFIGIVPHEFEFKPESDAAWETDYIRWMSYGDIVDKMKTESHDFHPGLIRLFRESKRLIESLIHE